MNCTDIHINYCFNRQYTVQPIKFIFHVQKNRKKQTNEIIVTISIFLGSVCSNISNVVIPELTNAFERNWPKIEQNKESK